MMSFDERVSLAARIMLYHTERKIMSDITIKAPQRTLCLFFLVGCSGSMDINRKMATLNQVIRELKPELEDALKKYPEIKMQIGCIKFSDRAEWHVGPALCDLQDFTWTDIQANG